MDISSFPIVEPLSEATQNALRPLRLREWDYLEIGMDENETAFLMRAVPRRIFTEGIELGELKTQSTVTGVKVYPINEYVGYETNEFLARIPESKAFSGAETRGLYKVGMTDYSVILVHCCWPRERLIFKSSTAAMQYDYLLRRFVSQTARANLQAKFKLEGVVPPPPKDYVAHDKYPLSDYQMVGMQMGLGQSAIALFMQKGTGKTATAIGLICLEANRTRAGKIDGTPHMMRALIVCPNQVRTNWQKEFAKFATTPGKTIVVRGGKLNRIKCIHYAFKTEADLAFSACIVGYDTLKSDPELFAKIPWDRIVLDESQKIKSQGTERWKAAKMLRENSARRVILTGTPIANTVMDLYTQLEFLGEGLSGFSSFHAFKEFHGKFEESVAGASGSKVKTLVGAANIPLMKERLARLSYTITKEEAKLNLPDKVYDTYEVDMTPRQADFYKRMVDALAILLKDEFEASNNKSITANHALTQLLRLAQICSGFVKWDSEIDPNTGDILTKGFTEQIDDTNPKMDAVLEMLRDEEKDPNEKTVIWACFVPDLQHITRILQEQGFGVALYYGGTSDKERDVIYERFNNDDTLKVLVANPATAGEGLNLLGYNPERTDQETYCGHMIFYSQNWSALERSQGEDRAHRRGTKMPLRITNLVIPETIDELIRNRVAAKLEMADNVQDISEILQEALGVDLSRV
jgi:SNF2 family DNA or RNA helicase